MATKKTKKLGDALRDARGDQSIEAFAKLLGVSKNTLGSYERGQGSLPDIDFLADVAKATNGDFMHLLQCRLNDSDAEGAMDALKFLSAAEDLMTDSLRAEQPRPGYTYIPLLDVAAQAGAGRVVETESVIDVLAFKEDWIRQELRKSPDDLRLIYVDGDSMEPDLRSGDIVLVDHTDHSARRDGIYVMRMDGALLVKQLQRLPGGGIKAVSRNASYEPFTITQADLQNGFAIIGRVVWACRRF